MPVSSRLGGQCSTCAQHVNVETTTNLKQEYSLIMTKLMVAQKKGSDSVKESTSMFQEPIRQIKSLWENILAVELIKPRFFFTFILLKKMEHTFDFKLIMALVSWGGRLTIFFLCKCENEPDETKLRSVRTSNNDRLTDKSHLSRTELERTEFSTLRIPRSIIVIGMTQTLCSSLT